LKEYSESFAITFCSGVELISTTELLRGLKVDHS